MQQLAHLQFVLGHQIGVPETRLDRRPEFPGIGKALGCADPQAFQVVQAVIAKAR